MSIHSDDQQTPVMLIFETRDDIENLLRKVPLPIAEMIVDGLYSKYIGFLDCRDDGDTPAESPITNQSKFSIPTETPLF